MPLKLRLILSGCFLSGCLLAAVAASLPAHTQEPAQQLQETEQNLVLSATRQKELEAAVAEAMQAQEELSQKLVAQAAVAAGHERKLASLAVELKDVRQRMATLNLDLAQKRDVISQILAGLQRLEHNPPPALVVNPDDVLGALRGAMILGSIAPELRRAADDLHAKLTEIKLLREKLDADGKAETEALASLQATRATVTALLDEKKTKSIQTKEELAAERSRAIALADKATSLRELLDSLAAERARAEAKKSAEEKAKAEVARRLADEKAKPAIAFSKAQGQLGFPAEGRLVRLFGEDTGLGSSLDGIVITTAKAAQVTSPVSGKIEFAGPFRTYENMVMIDAGEGYLVLLAGLGRVDATMGQPVKAGEPIGAMGEKPGKLAMSNGLTNLTTPVLYVEFRKNGDPVDPAPWWIGNRQEAMR